MWSKFETLDVRFFARQKDREFVGMSKLEFNGERVFMVSTVSGLKEGLEICWA